MSDRHRWASTLNAVALRAGLFMAGAHIGIPGLSAIAGSALRNAQEFGSETLSIILDPNEAPEAARARIESEFAAQGIEADPDSWTFDDDTGELSFVVGADVADAAAEICGDCGDFSGLDPLVDSFDLPVAW